ncbi:ADSL-C domain-containing protein [Aphelenchoides bicaudatus]|nr:ADSL-C domain-containing protein [Aphelenchoides bicaudatus]
MSSNWDQYETPLTQWYQKNGPLLKLFSERSKIENWRQLWIWLAEAEQELEISQITDEMIATMKANKSIIDKEFILAERGRLKNEVLAQKSAFGKVLCPQAAGIISLSATSSFVQDNWELIRQKQALDLLIEQYLTVMEIVARFSEQQAKTLTVGRTHWQTASLMTAGKRSVHWLQELLMVFKKLINFRANMRFLGIKSTLGNQDSILELFNKDDNKVQQLDALITEKAGFKSQFHITDQSYPRQQDAELLFILSQFGAASDKICKDIRFLQSQNELVESCAEDQNGNTPMSYKRNPMKAEKVCALSRKLILDVFEGLMASADQGVKRPYDDSASCRVHIPDAFLCMAAVLSILQTIFEGLRIHESLEQKVNNELPFLALEKATTLLTIGEGVDLQSLHAKIRKISQQAKIMQEHGDGITLEEILSDSLFNKVRIDVIAMASEPINFAGTCIRQVNEFLKDEYRPVVEPFLKSFL